MNLIRVGDGSVSSPGKGYTPLLSIPAQVKRAIGLKDENRCVFYKDSDSDEIIIRFEDKEKSPYEKTPKEPENE